MVQSIEYLCSCSSSWPLSRLYFCTYCKDLRCLRCLSHEAETFYCPHCIEPLPPSDARAHGCICSKCLRCPCCENQLAVKASQSTNPQQSTSRQYYLLCSVCLWSSRDVGIPDSNALPQASHFFHPTDIDPNHPLQPDADVSFSHAILEAFRELALVEKARAIALTKSRRKSAKKHSIIRLNARQVSNLNPNITMERFPKVETGVPEPLSDDFIENGAPKGKEFSKPLPRHLAVRRCLRCVRCDHVVCLPELKHGHHSHPWFRLSLGAAAVLPTIRVDNMSAWPPAANLLFYHPIFSNSATSGSNQASSSGEALKIRVEPSAPFELVLGSKCDEENLMILEQPGEFINENRDLLAEKYAVKVTVIADLDATPNREEQVPLLIRIQSDDNKNMPKFIVRVNFSDS